MVVVVVVLNHQNIPQVRYFSSALVVCMLVIVVMSIFQITIYYWFMPWTRDYRN